MALARAEGSPQRFYSMSAQIRRERDAYYDALERSQKGELDVTDWLVWFPDCLDRAILRADDVLGEVLREANVWERLRDITDLVALAGLRKDQGGGRSTRYSLAVR